MTRWRSPALRAAMLGAGGAARAVTVALASSGSLGPLHARNRRAGGGDRDAHSVDVGGWPPAPGTWDLLVNCTPVGMYPHVDARRCRGDADGALRLRPDYNPTTTRLLRDAASRGLPRRLAGLDMLVAQADEAVSVVDGLAGAGRCDAGSRAERSGGV